ncbi:aminotransferase [Phaeobacter gallaeciensis]|uniref:aspartate transaminase n=2 Tax=Roseobacteraceae TaxID=2854170 RepID=A0A366WSE4_9RHOB|nr:MULTISPECIES: aminotransferase [Roseobacteraceae]MBT3140407.1 aminotransferase [Falsiruegeria litorea]MBT8171192.1 aminotransferase [Falsiruegeria litorea]RBW51711.1 aminotransferase [Phaeobacter gallaeciensis]
MSQSRTATTFPPPVMEARRWLEGVSFPVERPLINVSQAAPVEPPTPELRKAMADFALNEDSAHLYGPVLGNDDLRTELAHQISEHYHGQVAPSQVAITSGCNQAFSATISALTTEGDEVILPTPWYFNHKMWLDMAGVTSVALQTGDDLLPDPTKAEALITPRTRAISLVTPNNPGGVEYPAELVQAFFDLARKHEIRLLVDETYRDFDSRAVAPHPLFSIPNWDETLVHLYSFSKAYRLTGHRVGALATSTALLAEIEKFLDTVAICPGQIGQHAALWGMQNLETWLAGERQEILDRRAAIADFMPDIEAKGWKLRGLGAYFAYLEHPYDMPSDELARRLVSDAGVLLLPGTMFMPASDAAGQRQVRIAFANLDRAGLRQLFDRLQSLSF